MQHFPQTTANLLGLLCGSRGNGSSSFDDLLVQVRLGSKVQGYHVKAIIADLDQDASSVWCAYAVSLSEFVRAR